jgi:hypothetical protein
MFFSGSTEFSSRLCEMLLQAANSERLAVRERASALLYLTMRKNYTDKDSSSFSRIKVQMTIALSRVQRLPLTP